MMITTIHPVEKDFSAHARSGTTMSATPVRVESGVREESM
jgi:hypothetical protein